MTAEEVIVAKDRANASSAASGTTSRLPRLGPRGEGWVILQVVFLAVIVAAGLRGPRWPGGTGILRAAWAVPTAALGAYLFIAGSSGLGQQLTPFPRPVKGGDLRRKGAYGIVRHPIYGGVLLLAFAWALLTSALALLPWMVTVAFFDAKRRREEAWLVERLPSYVDYRRDVRHAFLPCVW
jgi:protein-S-isoprenylcysteine O-methyltransferase Ste14